MLIKTLRGFAVIWFVLASLLVLGGMLTIWYQHGFGRVQEIFSPFNVWNLLAVIITFAPGIAAHVLAERLEDNRWQRNSTDVLVRDDTVDESETGRGRQLHELQRSALPQVRSPVASGPVLGKYCPRCRHEILEPRASDTSNYARYWRGVCPECTTPLVGHG